MNKDVTKLETVDFEETDLTQEELLESFLVALAQKSSNADYQCPIATGVSVLGYELEGGQLQISFSSDYSQMDTATEILSRAAIVYTLVQLDIVDQVAFYVGETPLTTSDGTTIGYMNADSFVESLSDEENYIQEAQLTLYFASENGKYLITETRACFYNSNVSIEKVILEQLMLGPEEEGKATIPGGTKLVSVSVLDGVCFVNFDDGFLTQNYEIEEGVVIYSIVNSLAELSNINKVQITVNGDSSAVYRSSFSFGTIYERDLDYLTPVEETEKTENE